MIRERLTQVFRSRTRDEWCEIMEGTDACFAPVLSMTEARDHPHNRARDAFVELEGIPQPRPAPRFSRTDARLRRPPAPAGAHTAEVLADWGFSEREIAELRALKAAP